MRQEISCDNRNPIVRMKKTPASPWSEIPSRLFGHIPVTAIKSLSLTSVTLLEQHVLFNFLLSAGK